MVQKNVTKPKSTELVSPTLFAPKKDGSLRFCVYFRKLNAIAVLDSYPIPSMDECVLNLGSAELSVNTRCQQWIQAK